MPAFRTPIFRALVLAWAAGSLPVAEAAQLRLIWEGLPGMPVFEIETATDAGFTKNTQVRRLPSNRPVLDAAALPAFVRARALRPDGQPATNWQAISTRQWPAPRLPQRIEISRKESGTASVSWDDPDDSPLGGLIYRARIFDKTGTTLADQIVPSTRFVVPDLPGGIYELQIEALGGPKKGSLHQDGQSAAATVVSVEAMPFDPAHPDVAPLSFLQLTSAFIAGPLLKGSLGYRFNGYQRTSVLTLESRFTSEGGFRVGAKVPVTWLDSGGAGRQAPRLGGSPQPEFGLGQRLFGSNENFVGLHLNVATDTDTSSTPVDVTRTYQASTGLTWRIKAGNVAVDAAGLFGINFPRDGISYFSTQFDLKPQTFGAVQLSPSYFFRDRWQFGLSFTAVRLDTKKIQIRGVAGTTILAPAAFYYVYQPFVGYRITRTSFLQAGIDRASSELLETSLEPLTTFGVSYSFIF